MTPQPTAEPGPGVLTVAVGAGAMSDDAMVLDLGAEHPSTHGGLRLALTLDNDRIVSADPRIGFVHRGAEKLFEVRDYRQIIMLTNRHDWLSAFANELGLVLAVERLMGLTVPPRAVWLRTALAELNRASAGLAFLGSVPGDDGAPIVDTWADRDRLLAVLEEVSGGRVHFMFNRIGGVKEDVPDGWLQRAREAIERVGEALPERGARLLADEAVRRVAGQAVVPAALVPHYGLSGPVARACGVDLDLRRADPYLAYPELDVRSATRDDGDGPARLACLLDDVGAALGLAATCLDRLPAGPVNVRLPKVVRPPEGEIYAWTENPLGITGYYLVSRGGTTPWRLKLRTASFATLAAVPEVLPGVRLADLPLVLASLFFVLGDADR